MTDQLSKAALTQREPSSGYPSGETTGGVERQRREEIARVFPSRCFPATLHDLMPGLMKAHLGPTMWWRLVPLPDEHSFADLADLLRTLDGSTTRPPRAPK